MKAQELRIGNYVADIWNPDIPRQVQSLAKNLCIYGSLRCKYDKLLPIRLTEKWLVKLGAKKIHDILDIYELARFELYPFYKYGFWKVVDKETKAYIAKVSYVHELQNMCFILTGEELCTQ